MTNASTLDLWLFFISLMGLALSLASDRFRLTALFGLLTIGTIMVMIYPAYGFSIGLLLLVTGSVVLCCLALVGNQYLQRHSVGWSMALWDKLRGRKTEPATRDDASQSDR